MCQIACSTALAQGRDARSSINTQPVEIAFSSFSVEVVGMPGQQRYALALGTAALHLFGFLLLTVEGIKTATFLIAGYAR